MSSLPSMMKAGVVRRDSSGFSFHITTVPLPQLAPTDILVRLTATGVCGTDIGLASGKLGPTHEILGHEGVGRIVALGSAVPAASSSSSSPCAPDAVAVGARVGLAWLRDACGACAFCLHPGGETRCAARRNSGRAGVGGTFAEYAVVPARYVVGVPDELGVRDDAVAPVLCGGVTAYKALRESGVAAGGWVAVSGAGGGVGAFAVQYAAAMGCRVVALDAGDAKRAYCLALGAEAYVDVADEDQDVVAAVRSVTAGAGVAAALAIAGTAKAYQAALEFLGPFGTLVCVGIPPPWETVSFHPLLFIDKGVRIVGSAVGTREDIRDALGFVARGLVKPTVLPAKLEDLPHIANTFAQVTGKYVIKFGESDSED
ncbi:hypothetical protein BDY21DRAFT_366350 [Lineolata rhizophorae]|uniref:Enoyl reductase (ER) domain-containing protein n=1 Tax=Lineolata rhizophorae TaxID=578093 RepID=A0A6A6NRW6_9PEZI|nr:hypothetical protein BDY21DRAFT_366350 [Lineolata rhizophorae]